MFLHGIRTGFPYRRSMCADIPDELEGQISINELLVAMGEPPVEPMTLAAPDDASSLFDMPAAEPGPRPGRG
ncbi:hypothetical protein GCM10023063_19420 [Arthrobacter methylotrophus]